MFALTRSDIQRVAISALGAMIVSTACVAAAVSPAKADTPPHAITRTAASPTG